MKSNKITRIVRRILLAVFLIAISYVMWFDKTLGMKISVSVHALCPYGPLESLYAILYGFFNSGVPIFIGMVMTGTLLMFTVIVAVTIIFRRSFCGLLCPLGALQEGFGWIGKKIFKKQLVVPSVADKPLRYLKYVLLILTAVMAFWTGKFWMDHYCVWSTYARLFDGFSTLLKVYTVGFILLVISLIGSLLFDRFLCKYLCPMGAFTAVVGKISPYQIERDNNKCTNCNQCTEECPVNIDVASCTQVTSAECIDCQLCVNKCPVEGALNYKMFGKKIKGFIPIIFVVILFFSPVLAATYIPDNLIPKMKPSEFFNMQHETVPTLSDLFNSTSDYRYKGTGTKNEILNRAQDTWTIKDVANILRVTVSEVYEALGIPADAVPETTRLKDINRVYPEFDWPTFKEINKTTTDPSMDRSQNPASEADIKTDIVTQCTGMFAIQQVAETLGVEISEIYKALGVPDTVPADTLLKDIKNFHKEFDW